MGKVEPYLLDEITESIMRGARKVFAILVLIEEVWLVKDLMQRYQVLDHGLPLSLETLRNFTVKVALNFNETQWQFLAPQFGRSMLTKQIPQEKILPFLKDEKIGEGGFGAIYEISLDPEHQDHLDEFSKRVSCT
jgi:hypothetical protein